MNILYLSYWGINDPLTVSTVYPHLRILSDMDQVDSVVFCTIERERKYHRPDALAELNKVQWTSFDSGHGIMSKLQDFYFIPKKLRKIIQGNGIDALLCRGAPAGALGYLVWKKTGIPFYVESFEPHADYMLEGGVWSRYDPRYILEKRWEKKQVKHAKAILPVSGNHRLALLSDGVEAERVHTIPCAVNPEDFRFDAIERIRLRSQLGIPENALVGIYVGKFGDIYHDKKAFAVFKAAYDYFDLFHLVICSSEETETLVRKMDRVKFPEGSWTHRFVPHSDVPKYLSASDFGFALIKSTPSRRYCSPVKVGEYWANGLPVLITEGIGDDSEIIDREQAGAVLDKGFSNLQQVFQGIQKVIAEEGHRQRIAGLAGKHRSFDRTREVYQKIFSQLTSIHYFVHHRPDRSPGQRFRCEQYLPFLEEQGFDIQWHNLLDEEEDQLFYAPGKWSAKARLVVRKWFQRNTEVRQVKQGDIAFVYREAYMLGTARFERKLKKRGAKLIFDFDDAIWLREVSEGNKKLSFLKRPGKAADLCRLSDLVIVGNEYLAGYARQFTEKVAVVPTTIDTDYHRPVQVSKPQQKICIGWTGSETTIKHFETIIPALEKVKAEYGDWVYFKLITNRPVAYPSLDLKATLWDKYMEVEQLAQLDIGIMPLPDDEWSKGKCGFKLLQYMAMEKPVVASPVGVNTEIVVDHKNGYLASNEEEWVKRISDLINDGALRNLFGKAGRQMVVQKYSVAGQRKRYVELFKYLSMERGHPRPYRPGRALGKG